MDTGVTLFQSWRTALQRTPWLALKLAVVRRRADPLLTENPRTPSTAKAAVTCEEKLTVPPGATDSEVAEASFRAAPPSGPRASPPVGGR